MVDGLRSNMPPHHRIAGCFIATHHNATSLKSSTLSSLFVISALHHSATMRHRLIVQQTLQHVAVTQ
jgi:hypothetical protein